MNQHYFYYFHYYFSPPLKTQPFFISSSRKGRIFFHMEDLPGALGTSASLALRMGQSIFAIASLIFMCLGGEFYSYTSYCFLITIMGLVIPWSSTLAMVDMIAVFITRPARRPGIIAVAVVGDWVLSFLSLAAACSTASVTHFLHIYENFCDNKLCTRFQLASVMALMSWFLLLASSLFNLWLIPSMS